MEVGVSRRGVEVDVQVRISCGVVVVVQASGFRSWGVNPSVYQSNSVYLLRVSE